MNKTLLSATLAAAIGAVAFIPTASAASLGSGPIYNASPDGTLTVNGQVLTQSCTVDTKAAGTSDPKTVTLPDQWKTALAASGNTAGATGFTIVIAGCDPALTTVQTYFSGGLVDATTHNLTNTAGGTAATNVEVQLLDGQNANAAIDLTKALGLQTTAANLTAGGVTLNYQAQYYATGVSTAGAVTATTSFTMIYN